MTKAALQLLVVEDSLTDQVLIRESLLEDNLATYELTVVELLEQALALLGQYSFDLVLLDLGLPDSLGLETFSSVQQAMPSLPVIVLSGRAEEDLALQAVQAGAQDYLVKGPHGMSGLARAIRYAIERQRNQARLRHSETQLQAIVSSLDDMVFEVDEQGTCLNIWTADDSQLYISRQQQIGRRFDQIFGQELARPFYAMLERVLRSGIPDCLDYPLELPDGQHWFTARYCRVQFPGQSRKTVAITVRDTTERHLSQENLRQSEADLAQAQRIAKLGSWRFDVLTDTTTWSSELYRIYEVDPEAFDNRRESFLNRVHPDDREMVKAFSRHSIQDGLPFELEFRILTPSGVKTIHEIGHTLCDAAGQVTGLIGTAQDITEQKRTAALVLAQRDMARAAGRFDSLEAGLQYCLETATNLTGLDCGGIYLYNTDRQRFELAASLGLSEAFIQEVSAFLPDSPFGQAILRGRIFSLPATLPAPHRRQPQDEGLLTLVTASISYQDQVIGCLNLASHTLAKVPQETLTLLETLAVEIGNLVVHLHGEAALRASEEQYRRLAEELEQRVRERAAEVQDLYDNAPTGYHSLDSQGRFIRINRTGLNLRGYTAEEMLGKPFTDFLAAEGRQEFDEHFARFKQSGQIKDLEIVVVRKDGSTYPALLSATAVYDEAGNFRFSRSTVIDITERKQAEETLRFANQELARAMRLKDEFLASMSHELRTPLTGILGMSEILQLGTYGELNAKQDRTVSVIQDSGRHLLELINDMLDLSKIEAGMLELEIQPLALEDVCQASLQLVKGMAGKKRQQISLAMTPPAIAIQADGRRLKQMLGNLLSNAIKFTPEAGPIGLEVRASPAEQQVRLTVWDTGMGIAPQDLERLFQPFVQLDEHQAGTGLGLVLVKRLAELHGGTVSVTSAPGMGSRFTISLPWQPEPAAGESLPGSHSDSAFLPALPNAASYVILLAEDTEANILLVGDFLESLGCRTVFAVNGRDALEKASECHPNLILMDVLMPEMDGLTAIRLLRQDPTFATTPIIALTALAMPGDRERCLAAGATEYLTKPVRLAQLGELIRKLLEGK